MTDEMLALVYPADGGDPYTFTRPPAEWMNMRAHNGDLVLLQLDGIGWENELRDPHAFLGADLDRHDPFVELLDDELAGDLNQAIAASAARKAQ